MISNHRISLATGSGPPKALVRNMVIVKQFLYFRKARIGVKTFGQCLQNHPLIVS